MEIFPVKNNQNIWKKSLSGGNNIIMSGAAEPVNLSEKINTLSNKDGLNVIKPDGHILIKQGFVQGDENIRGTELVYDFGADGLDTNDWMISIDGQFVSGEPDLAEIKRVLFFLTEDRELATGNFVCAYQKNDNKLYIVASDGTNILTETVIYDFALTNDVEYSITIKFGNQKFGCQVNGAEWYYVDMPDGYSPGTLRYLGWGFLPIIDDNTLLQIDFRYDNCLDITGKNKVEWCQQDIDNNIKPGLIGACMENVNCGKIPDINESGYSVIALIKPGTANEQYLKIGNTDFAVTGADIDRWLVDITTGAETLSGEGHIFGNSGSDENPTTSTINPTTSTVKPSVVMNGSMAFLAIRKNIISNATKEQVELGLISAAANLKINKMTIL